MPTLREQILAVDDIKIEPVDVPEWGVSVWVRSWTGRERDMFESEHRDLRDEDYRARLVVSTACDEAGQLLFTRQDIPALAKKNAKALDRLSMAAISVNRITPEDVEELEKKVKIHGSSSHVD
jgi:hypothetical protein